MTNPTIATVFDRIEAQQALQLRPDATSLELLQAVYRNPSMALPVRIRWAMAALPFEHPKLQVVSQVTENSFAEILERRIRRFAEMENAKVIEKPPPKVEVKPPLPRLSDRRFRRL